MKNFGKNIGIVERAKNLEIKDGKIYFETVEMLEKVFVKGSTAYALAGLNEYSVSPELIGELLDEIGISVTMKIEVDLISKDAKIISFSSGWIPCDGEFQGGCFGEGPSKCDGCDDF